MSAIRSIIFPTLGFILTFLKYFSLCTLSLRKRLSDKTLHCFCCDFCQNLTVLALFVRRQVPCHARPPKGITWFLRLKVLAELEC